MQDTENIRRSNKTYGKSQFYAIFGLLPGLLLRLRLADDLPRKFVYSAQVPRCEERGKGARGGCQGATLPSSGTSRPSTHTIPINITPFHNTHPR